MPGGAPAGHVMPELEKAANTLGISEQDLMQAIQGAGGIGPQLDIEKAATALGVFPDALNDALPKPPGQ